MATRLRNEVCDFRERGQGKRSKRQRNGNPELRARIEYLENEIKSVSVQRTVQYDQTSRSSRGGGGS